MFWQRSLMVLSCMAGFTVRGLAQASGTDRVALRLDTAEAVAVLAILERQASGRPVGDSAWGALFAAEGYVRLKAREASLHRDFSDSPPRIGRAGIGTAHDSTRTCGFSNNSFSTFSRSGWRPTTR